MAKSKATKLLCLVLSLLMILGAAPLTAFALDPVKYVYREWDETTKKVVESEKSVTDYELVTEDTTEFESGKWYVVKGTVTVTDRIGLWDTAHLILTDGSKLTAIGGINLNVLWENDLSIYGQSGDTGILEATAGEDNAAIGSEYSDCCGTITVYGGTVIATGGRGSAGIGGKDSGTGGTITVYGGSIKATGGYVGAGIGGGGTVTVYGGSVKATGGGYGTGIGGGGSGGNGGTVTINGGTVEAIGADGYRGIGGGSRASSHGTLSVPSDAEILAGSGKDAAAKVNNADFCNDHSATYVYIECKTHEHSFAAAWSSDKNAHWHACTAEGCDITDYASCGFDGAAYGAHTVVNGVCTVCDRVFTVYTAEDNVLTATVGATPYTLTLKDDGTISAEEISAWETAGMTVPEIVLDAAANTASITAEEATATAALAQGALKTHSVKVICGADENGNSYITDVLAGTDVTVIAGTYEGKLFEKWISDLSIDGSTDETVTFRMPNEDVTLEAEFVDCYPLSVFDGTTLTSEPQKVNYSASVTVPATPEGMRFTGWTAEGITLTDPMASVLEFTMPGNAVMLTANFAELYTVTVTDGKLTGFGTSGEAIEGETVFVSADADNNDSRFTEWSSEAGITFADKTAKNTSFTMPASDITVTADREQSHTVTVTDGKVTSGLNGANKAFAGQTITVTANNISGHTFTGWTGEGVTFADATSAVTTFTMPESNVTVKANYEQIKVAPPTAGTKTYTFNGNAQTYEFAGEGDKSGYSLSGNVQTNAGTFTVKAHLNVDGSVWTDGTTADKEFTFTIARQPIDKPMAYNTQYYYTGKEQEIILCRQVNGNYYYYETTVPAGSVSIMRNTRTDVGSQAVMVAPTSNYCWPDGSTGYEYFTFTINKYPVPTLFSDPRSFTYNGNAQTYTPFVLMSDGLYDFDGLFYNLSNRTQTDIGSYTVTATLNDNCCWYDGSTAPRNFTFNIERKKLESFIYYVDDLKTGENEVCVDMTYTSFDNTNALPGFGKHPAFKAEMLKDRYQPCLMNVPAGADVEFYLKETPGTPKSLSEAFTYTRWDRVKMSDLKPDTIYYMFALVTHPDYELTQITEVNNMSRFITSIPEFTLQTRKTVNETEVDPNYKFNCAMAMYSGNINDMLGAFGVKSSSKTVNITAKKANYSILSEAMEQAVKDIEEGLDGVLVSWYDEKGVEQSFSILPSNIAQAKTALANLKAKSAAPKRMLAAPAGDPAPVEITGISGEPAEFTSELLNALFGAEELDLTALNSAEFKMEKGFDLAAEQIEGKNEDLIESLAANGLIPEAGEPDELFGTVTINSLLYDFKSEAVDGGTDEYEIKAGELLPANAVKEIDGYTFIGLYYAEIMGFEKDSKSEEATGDHGMILTQGLVKWDPETDIVTRDLDLMALYVKDGAEEPVNFKADGTTFLDDGCEATVTLPALLDGMTYGDVVNDNEDITVSAVVDGKVTVTLNNDVTGDEPFTFTVGVNANKEGVEDPFYYIFVTVSAVEAADVKEEAGEAIEALADDTASDEVKAIIADAVAALADANSVEAVNEIMANAEAAVALQTAKEEAIAAIDEALGEDATDEMVAAADEAKAAVEAAETLDEVEAAKEEGLTAIDDADGRCPYCGEKKHTFFSWIRCICKRIANFFKKIFGIAG